MKKLVSLLLTVLLLLGTVLPCISFGAETVSPEDYDRLYVQDGLTVAFAATRDALSDVDFQKGTWKSRVGDRVAHLRSGNSSGWSETRGGIGYSMTKADWKKDQNLGSNYLDFGEFLLEDYTVELVSIWTGLTKSDGSPHVDNEDVWGVHTQAFSALEIGARKGTGFISDSVTERGTGHSIRESYTPGHWGSVNINCWFTTLTLGEEDFRVQPTSTVFTGKVGTFSRQNVNILDSANQKIQGATHSVSDVTGYEMQTYLNGKPMYRYNTVISSVSGMHHCAYTDGNGKVQNDGFERYLQPNESYLPGGNLYLMRDYPGTVYAVRIYDRELSPEELRQNRFVDRCRISGVDLKDFFDLPEEEKTRLYLLTDSLPLQMSLEDKEELQKYMDFFTGKNPDIAEKLVSYRGLQARLDGPIGIRALFRMNKQILRLLESKYTVRCGVLAAGENTGILQEELTVKAENGELLPEKGEMLLNYTTDSPDNLLVTDNTEFAEFAYAPSLSGTTEEKAYSYPLLFRGFVAVTDSRGKTDILYTDAKGDLFGREDSLFGPGASLGELADHLVNGFRGSYVKERDLNQNWTLRKIIETLGGEIEDFRPGRAAKEYREIFVDSAFSGESLGTEDAPLKTVGEALKKAKEIFRMYPSVSVAVHLKSGIYRETETLTLTGKDMSENQYFTLIGEPGATVTGARELPLLWNDVPGKPYKRTFIPSDENGNMPNFRFLYVDGEIADIAYSGYKRYTEARDEGEFPAHTGTADKQTGKIYCEETPFLGIDDDAFRGAEFHISVEWEFKIFHIDHIDRNDREGDKIAVYLKELNPNVAGNGNLNYRGRSFWLENRLEFLDEPGEYCFDKGLLYYYPETDIESSVFEIPVLEQMFRMEDVENVSIDGVTVTGLDNRFIEKYGYYCGGQAGHSRLSPERAPAEAAFRGKNLRNFTFTDVNVEYVPGDGLALVGALDNITVTGCGFYEIGRSAIRMGDGNRFTENAHLDNCLIHNNYIDGAAWFHREAVAMYISVARDLKITHNTIQNCSYSGMSLGWSWSPTTEDPQNGFCNLYRVEVGFNRMENFMTDMSDGGGIYTLGGNANVETYNDVYFNFLHDNMVIVTETTGGGHGRFMPLYHDEGSSNWHDTGNIVVDYPGNRGLGSFYLQAQWHPTRGTRKVDNVLVEETFFMNAGNITDPVVIAGQTIKAETEEEYIVKISFWNHLPPLNDAKQRNNHVIEDMTPTPGRCENTFDHAGVLQ